MVKKWDWRRVKSILFYSQIFCSQMNNFNPNMLRSKVGALLAEVPNGRLQVIFQISESLLFAEKECRETILNLDPSFRFSSSFWSFSSLHCVFARRSFCHISLRHYLSGTTVSRLHTSECQNYISQELKCEYFSAEVCIFNLHPTPLRVIHYANRLSYYNATNQLFPVQAVQVPWDVREALSRVHRRLRLVQDEGWCQRHWGHIRWLIFKRSAP